MTTVVYHRGVLAADTRTTHASRELQCPDCGYHGFAVTNTSEKVQLSRGSLMFREEKVVAISGAGGAEDIAQAIKLMEYCNIETIYQSMNTFNRKSGRGRKALAGCSFTLLIVTEKSLYQFRFNSALTVPEVQRYERDVSFCVGSGAKAAWLALTLFGDCTAMDIVKVAMIADISTGGRVSWVDTTQAKPEVQVEQLQSGELQKFAETLKLNVGSIRLARVRPKELKADEASEKPAAKKAAKKKVVKTVKTPAKTTST